MNDALHHASAPAARGGSSWLHLLALLTVVAMFPLIWMGGLVTSRGAGMSVPDWPNTWGYNMFAVRWDLWIGEAAGGIFYEHMHRLLGTVVGFLALWAALAAFGVARSDRLRRWWGRLAVVTGLGGAAVYVLVEVLKRSEAVTYEAARQMTHVPVLAICVALVAGAAWTCRRREERAWVRWLAAGVLAAVIVQGVIGGLRVVWVDLNLAIAHGILAQVTLCAAGVLALATSRWWRRASAERGREASHGQPPATASRGAVGVSVVLLALLLGQLAVAAFMRHYEAGLAIPDFPLHYGQVLPPMSQGAMEEANLARAFDHRLPPTTLGAVWLHMSHRIGAVLVSVAVFCTVWRVWQTGRLRWHAASLAGLLVLQVVLGILTIWTQRAADVATAHVAGGALLLLASVLLTGRLLRLYGWRPAPGGVWKHAEAGSPAPATEPTLAGGARPAGAARQGLLGT